MWGTRHSAPKWPIKVQSDAGDNGASLASPIKRREVIGPSRDERCRRREAGAAIGKASRHLQGRKVGRTNRPAPLHREALSKLRFHTTPQPQTRQGSGIAFGSWMADELSKNIVQATEDAQSGGVHLTANVLGCCGL
jgi:hypothetical protein